MSDKGDDGVVIATPKIHQPHRGDPVQVGPYTIHAGGKMHLNDVPIEEFAQFDCAVMLLEEHEWPDCPLLMGRRIPIRYPIPDMSGVPADWSDFIEEMIALLDVEVSMIAFCMGGHGRTGALIASLIAKLEPEVVDPIAAVRERYCVKAVETIQQAEAVFALKGTPLPSIYKRTLMRGSTLHT